MAIANSPTMIPSIVIDNLPHGVRCRALAGTRTLSVRTIRSESSPGSVAVQARLTE